MSRILSHQMALWNLFWLILLIVVIYLVVRKIVNEAKVKNGRIELAGKVVMITGASSGIGEALAHEFYMAGCRVVLASRRVGELERVRSNLLNLRLSNADTLIRPDIIQLDLANIEQLTAKCEQILELCNHVDILINNGGVSLRSDTISVKTEVDIRMMYTNYFGAVTLTKGLLPTMMQRKQGKIVFVSSVVGRLPIPYRSAYTASKHALQAFADCLRAEMAAYNIQVLVSSPGYVATDVSMNALTGYGTAHGVMDPETAAGETPQKCAHDIVRAMLRDDNELIPLKFAFVVWLRVTWPSLYFWLMARRADKLASRYRNTTQSI